MFLPAFDIAAILQFTIVPLAFLVFSAVISEIANIFFAEKYLREVDPKKFVPWFATANFLNPNWASRIATLGMLLRFETGSFRALHFAIVFSSLGLLLPLFLPLLAFSVNPLLLVLLVVGAYIGSFFFKRLWAWTKVFAAISLVIFSFQMVFHQGSTIQNFLQDTNVIWVLTDGRWGSCVLILCGSIFLTLLFRFPFLIIWSGVILFYLQSLSLNGLVFAFAGEILGFLVLVSLKAKVYTGTLKTFFTQWQLFSGLGLLIGTVLSWVLISCGLGRPVSFDDPFEMRWLEVIFILACMPIGMCLATGAWGHFGYQKLMDGFRGSGNIILKPWDRLWFAGSWSWLFNALDERVKAFENAEEDLSSFENPLDLAKVPVMFRDRILIGLKDLNLQLENLRSFLRS